MRPTVSKALVLALLGHADAFSLCALGAPGARSVCRAAVSALESPPPPGFVWADYDTPAASTAAETDVISSVGESAAASAVAETAVASASETSPADLSGTATETLKGVVVPTQPKPAKKVVSSQGIFAPLVLGAKRVMGEQELKELRASIIAKHSKVIAEFVDTSESQFGQLVLRRMFEYADKDGNGTLDKDEVRAALYDLGFDFLDQKQIDKIVDKADADKNEVIDFEEFVKMTPRALRGCGASGA